MNDLATLRTFRTAPLHERLRMIDLYQGHPRELAALGASIDRDGMVTITTQRGPEYMWAHSLRTAAAGAKERYLARTGEGWGQIYHKPPAPPPPKVAAPAKAAALREFMAGLDSAAKRKPAKDGRVRMALPNGYARFLPLMAGEELRIAAGHAFTAAPGNWLGRAPARAVGNFTTAEAIERTLEGLEHNLREARTAGNAALEKVMLEAIKRAHERAGI